MRPHAHPCEGILFLLAFAGGSTICVSNEAQEGRFVMTINLSDLVASANKHGDKAREKTIDEVGQLIHRIEKLAQQDDADRLDAMRTLANMKGSDPKFAIALTLLSGSPTALADATQMLGGSANANTNGHAGDDAHHSSGRAFGELSTLKFGPDVKKHTRAGRQDLILIPMVDKTGKVQPGHELAYESVLNEGRQFHYDPADPTTILGYYGSQTDSAPTTVDDRDVDVFIKNRLLRDEYVKTIKLSEAKADREKYEIKSDKKIKGGLKVYLRDNLDFG